MDIWSSRLEEARFLDLFAGSGAVGIEAMSRGAAELVLVDSDTQVVENLNATCQTLGATESKVISTELPAGLADPECRLSGEFDLIFADPPYAFDEYRELVLGAARWLATGGEIAIEHETRTALADRYEAVMRIDYRRYGDSSLSFYRTESDSQA